MAEHIARTPGRTGIVDRLDAPILESGWVVTLEQKLADRTERELSHNLRQRVIRALRKRDGDSCCFGPWCQFGGPIDFETPPHQLHHRERPSIEHRKPWYKHHSHRLEHLALAHAGCNQHAGRVQWAYIAREDRLAKRAPRIPINAWPALTYADELDFD